MRLALLLGLTVGLATAVEDDLENIMKNLVKTITNTFNLNSGSSSSSHQMQQGAHDLGSQFNQGVQDFGQSLNQFGNDVSNFMSGNNGGGHDGHMASGPDAAKQWAMDFMQRQTPNCPHNYDQDIRRAFPDCHDEAARMAGFDPSSAGSDSSNGYAAPEPEPSPQQMDEIKAAIPRCMNRQLRQRRAQDEFSCQFQALADMMDQHHQGGMHDAGMHGGNNHGMRDSGNGHMASGPDAAKQWAMDFMQRQTPRCPHNYDQDIRRAFPQCHDEAARMAGFDTGSSSGNGYAAPEPEPSPQQMDEIKAAMPRCMGRQMRERRAQDEFACQFRALSDMMDQHHHQGGGMHGAGNRMMNEGMGGHGEGGHGGHQDDGGKRWYMQVMRDESPMCPHRNDDDIAQAFDACFDQAMQETGLMRPDAPALTAAAARDVERRLRDCMPGRMRSGATQEMRCQLDNLGNRVQAQVAFDSEMKQALEGCGLRSGLEAVMRADGGECHDSAAWDLKSVVGPQGVPDNFPAIVRRVSENYKQCMREAVGSRTDMRVVECVSDASVPIMSRHPEIFGTGGNPGSH